MKNVIPLLLALVLTGCKPNLTPENIRKLNGYWEIEKVKLPDGKVKAYAPGYTVDYLYFDGASGYRMKVTPQLDGKYQSNGVKESITTEFPDGKVLLYYQTGFAHWKEELLEADAAHFVTRNDNNLTYYYKKYEPLNLK